MNSYMKLGMMACGLLIFPLMSFGQAQTVTGEKSVAFPQTSPQTYTCSTNSPCRNITGQILRIEESYWVRTPEGGETHLKVTRDTKYGGSAEGRRQYRSAAHIDRRSSVDRHT